MTKQNALEQLRQLDKDRILLAHAVAVLRWDQETYLPSKAVNERANQMAILERLLHEKLISKKIGKLLERLGSSREVPSGDETLEPVDRDFVRVLRREYDRECCLPPDFVAEAARAEGLSQAAWSQARQNDDFAAFRPHLELMVEYARRRSQYWGFDRPYDGLIDKNEEGMTESSTAAVLIPLADRIKKLLSKIAAKTVIDRNFLYLSYDLEKQKAYNQKVLNILGFDCTRGRLDVSAHPFTTTLGGDDIRITTHYFLNNPMSSLFSTIHEAGHALYEQAFDETIKGTCLADGASMGIHESQSRLWENVIGRSRAFWEGGYSALQADFPENLAEIDVEKFYKAINVVVPSLIRVDADEVSYSLHIALRFDLERRIFANDLAIADLPDAWRKGMRDLLGVEVPSDRDGVLQDVHWSIGAFGYFPSYALGNMYGLQLWRRFMEERPDYEKLVKNGNFAPIQSWLMERVHQYGRRMSPDDLLRNAVGETLSPDAFISYLENKYEEIYA